ncbi:OLC1v1005712C1 [Oldenlandia corymbosa var. corymbosa]|uniref:OLC1v1005712C1 n=1 Tax=Oldenlandia corymbosa var. corymbosa TaxID=529605 RepID=A0AAV1DHL4_OLDCO|nr:OLC1v1005712C1 [Oldenlandia corymbosa var. corymbosa]
MAVSHSFFFKSIVNFSTTTAATKEAESTQNADTVDYLINSLGFSKDAAIATLNKVPHSRPSPKKADSMVNYLENLGISKTHIRSMVSQTPKLLCCKMDKTLEPKVKFFRELGLSGSALVKAISGCWCRGLDTTIKSGVSYLKKLTGSDDNVVLVLKRWPRVLVFLDVETVDKNLKLLINYGLTHDDIVKWITRHPSNFFTIRPDHMKDTLHRVENVLGIPRNSAMFLYGVEIFSSHDRSRVDEKFGVFRSFGWPESSPDYLASHPVFLTLSFEKRVKPRNEVLKILNEKKLNKNKVGLFTVVILPESKFLKYYILPYKDMLPDLYNTYLSKAKIPEAEQ